MTTAPIRMLMPRKPPAKRLFSGVAGSPLARVNVPAAKSAQSTPPAAPVSEPQPGPVLIESASMKPGPKPRYGVAMTTAERQRQSRANRKLKQQDAKRRKLIAELMRIYRRQQGDAVFDSKRPHLSQDQNAAKRRQERSYIAQLMTLAIEDLQLALETQKQTPDTHGRLSDERSGEGTRAMGQSEIERLIAAKQHDSSLFEDEDQDPSMAGAFKVKPEGAGPQSFDARDLTADAADKPTTRPRIPTIVLERQKKTEEKMLALVKQVFDDSGHCHIEQLCMYDRTRCSFRAKNTDEAEEHLWAEYYRGERLWDHVRKLSDPAIAETIEPLLIEARKKAAANIHHWVIKEWIARYRKTWNS
jgi:hypothetical protein